MPAILAPVSNMKLPLPLWKNKNGVLSVQVLQEFYVNVSRKIKNPLTQKDARKIMQNYFAWQVVINKPEMILQGSEIGEKYMLSFWDSMIIAAAYQAKSKIILTEDLNHGQKIEGMSVTNPFLKQGVCL